MADKYGSYASESLGGSHDKPKKEIDHIKVRKAANGGHIMEHHHTHPEHHPVEHHTTKGDDAMVQHMLANAGTPNPGEDTSDPGSPAAQAAAPMAGNTSPSAPAAGGAAPVQTSQVASL